MQDQTHRADDVEGTAPQLRVHHLLLLSGLPRLVHVGADAKPFSCVPRPGRQRHGLGMEPARFAIGPADQPVLYIEHPLQWSVLPSRHDPLTLLGGDGCNPALAPAHVVTQASVGFPLGARPGPLTSIF